MQTETPGTQVKKVMFIGALGVVYGDIGTSPLYTMKVALGYYVQPGAEQVYGVLSLLFWLITLLVSLKYVTVVLRLDNKGEGGTLALMELAARGLRGKHRRILTVLGLIGASLFYGDSMITPAISVLSAIEGVGMVSPLLDPWVVPLAVVVLIVLFSLQSHGTGTMGKLFGPVMLCWFLLLGLLGLWRIIEQPQVLQAIDPRWAWHFIVHAPWQTFLVLGALVLALTGAEALYADMGHFGRPAIRRAWFSLVMPCLLLCYFGQGALLITDSSAIRNPFFHLAPAWGLIPLVIIATFATVIASQSVISGAYSVTRQAVQLGFWPRMVIQHTSSQEEGQIYLPKVNQLLFVAVLILVLSFGSSDRLAHAYGFAVTGTMLMTSLLAVSLLPRGSTGWKRAGWAVLLSVFLVLDVVLFSANALKLLDGGWLPLLVGASIFTMMWTWKQGRQQLHQTLNTAPQGLRDFMHDLQQYPPLRVPGTAVFMSVVPDVVPSALLHNLKHNKILHQQCLFLTVQSEGVPFVAQNERYQLELLAPDCWQAIAHWGFKQEPNVPALLEQISREHPELNLDPMQTSYYLSRQTVVITGRGKWRSRLFMFMARNAARSTRFFKIPPNRVVEMGMQVEL